MSDSHLGGVNRNIAQILEAPYSIDLPGKETFIKLYQGLCPSCRETYEFILNDKFVKNNSLISKETVVGCGICTIQLIETIGDKFRITIFDIKKVKSKTIAHFIIHGQKVKTDLIFHSCIYCKDGFVDEVWKESKTQSYVCENCKDLEKQTVKNPYNRYHINYSRELCWICKGWFSGELGLSIHQGKMHKEEEHDE